EIGDLERAVEVAADMAGVPAKSAPVRVPRPLLGRLIERFAGATASALADEIEAGLATRYRLERSVDDRSERSRVARLIHHRELRNIAHRAALRGAVGAPAFRLVEAPRLRVLADDPERGRRKAEPTEIRLRRADQQASDALAVAVGSDVDRVDFANVLG